MTNEHALEYLIATTPEEREQVFRLRYACYRRKGSIEAREDEQFSDRFDELPNSFSILVRTAQGEPVSTVRITVVRPDLGWLESPVQHVYGDHASLQSMASASYVEASRLCFGPQARRDAFLGLVAHMAALAEFYEAEWLAACPRVEHAEIYQRLFGFTPRATPRQYFGVTFETQLLGIRREELRRYVSKNKLMTSAWLNGLALLARRGGLEQHSRPLARMPEAKPAHWLRPLLAGLGREM